MTSNPPPAPPGPCPPPPPMMTPYQYPAPPPFYTWGAQTPAPPAPSKPAPAAPNQSTPYLPSYAPSPNLSTVSPSPRPLSAQSTRPVSSFLPPRPAVVAPVRPGRDADFTQHALDTVVAAAGAVHHQARSHNPELRETPHLRQSLAGVKRRSLAGELLAGGADSHHTSWTQWWDTVMPQQLMTKCKPLHCDLCSCTATSPVQAKMHYEGKTHDKNVRLFFQTWPGNTDNTVPGKLFSGEKRPRPGHCTNPHLHCDICDLYFTSQAQLEQHNQGKNHLKKMTAQEEHNYYPDEYDAEVRIGIGFSP